MKNHLSQEVSPYLLQHQSNPVWWYPWGNEAFEQARVRERPVFLSIGYSTCYWCHVMEKECFEDLDVASFLNEHFVSIKVDREEQPAVDQYYMDAVLGMTGHGGWPMSVMLTAERQPFWGGTYFPKLQFLNVLQQIHTAWISNRQKIYEISQKIGASLASLSTVDPGEGGEGRINEREEEAYTILKRAYDAEDGGFGRAPKFPPTQQIRFLLRRGANSDQAEAKQMALFTLERMACGGIYDQIGGGFSRYSVDEHWLVPHFEKMLYDNSLLLEAYVEAAQATGELFFEEVVGETADYLLRDMRSPEGGFFAAEDAGEVGREGEFYVFSYAELRAKLSAEEFTHLESLCFLTSHGNFEGNNVLFVKGMDEWLDFRSEKYRSIREKLKTLRTQRERPHRDEKILSAWNGLALRGLSAAYRLTLEERYLTAATEAAHFFQSQFDKRRELAVSYRNGEVRGQATLYEYSYLISGLLDLLQFHPDRKLLEFAVTLQGQQDKFLWNDSIGLYQLSNSAELPSQKIEFFDSATPSGNGVALSNLLRFERLFWDDSYRVRAQTLLAALLANAEQYPPGIASALNASFVQGYELLVGAEVSEYEKRELLEGLKGCFLPNFSHYSISLLKRSGLPLKFSLCTGRQCLPEVSTACEVLHQLDSVGKQEG